MFQSVGHFNANPSCDLNLALWLVHWKNAALWLARDPDCLCEHLRSTTFHSNHYRRIFENICLVSISEFWILKERSTINCPEEFESYVPVRRGIRHSKFYKECKSLSALVPPRNFAVFWKSVSPRILHQGAKHLTNYYVSQALQMFVFNSSLASCIDEDKCKQWRRQRVACTAKPFFYTSLTRAQSLLV